MEESFFGKSHYQDAVRRGDAHAHDGSHKRGDTERCVRDKEKQNNSGQRSGKRGDDDERIKPGLKIDHDEQVHQNDGKAQAADQANVGGAHGAVLTAGRDEAPTRKQLSVRFNNTVHIAANRTEIPVLYRSVDIDHTADIVVVDRGKLTRALYGSNIGEDRWPLLVRTTDWNIL